MGSGRPTTIVATCRWSTLVQSGDVGGEVAPVGPRRRSRLIDRPGVRVGGGFAGEVPGVEFLEGGIDVVDVERDV